MLSNFKTRKETDMNVRTQFGGGAISPKIAEHLKQASTQKSQFGGGAISPKVNAHLRDVKPVAKKVPTQFGGGAISPMVAKHLQAAR
jgi:hypothetical protein